MEKSSRWSSALYQLVAAGLFILALVMVDANVESGMNDDWSFIRTVRDLAATGHLRYNGWSAPLIGFQAYWGALFVKLFGFSFLAVRASSWVLTLMAIPMLWRLLRIVELSEKQAFFGLLAFLLSPLNLPNLATFMTDTPAFLLFATALLAALKAWQTRSESAAEGWVLITALCGFLSGSIRQVYWLSSICFLIILAVVRVRSARGRAVIGGCIALTLILARACAHWLAVQPYVPADDTVLGWKVLRWEQIIQIIRDEIVRAAIGATLMCLPFALLLAPSQVRRLPKWVHLAILAVAAALAIVYTNPLPWLGNTLTSYGVLLPSSLSIGVRPAILPRPLLVLLALAGLASSAYTASRILQTLQGSGWRGLGATGLGRFIALTAPFVAGYVMVLAIRAPEYGLYDRYLIPLVFLAGTMMLGVQARANGEVSALSWSAAALFAVYAVATTHDYFAEAKAKLAATNEVLRTGVSRGEILSGFEYDLWSEMDRTGHINSKLVKFPANAYRQTEDCNGDDDVWAWWRPMVPDLSERYVISISELSDLRHTKFPAVVYWRWLPPGRNKVYVEEVDPNEPPLSCLPGSGE